VPAWAKLAYQSIVVVVLGWAVADSAAQFRHWQHLFRHPAVYVFIAAWAAMAFLLGAAWALLLRWRFGVHLHLREWLPIQALAWGGRYLPGKLGLLAGKFALLGRGGLDGPRLAQSVLWEQLAFVLSAAVAAAIFLMDPIAGLPGAIREHWGLVRLLGGIGGIAVFLALDDLLRRLWPGARAPGAGLSPAKRGLLFLLYLAPHLVVGAGGYPVLCAMIPAAAPLGMTGMIGLLALANMAGILAFFAPAGMGVREAVLGVGLVPFAPLPAVLAFAAVLRLLTLIADALFFVLAGGVGLLARRRDVVDVPSAR
jgi:hypothetical protein